LKEENVALKLELQEGRKASEKESRLIGYPRQMAFPFLSLCNQLQ
jgi:hypothetical protein